MFSDTTEPEGQKQFATEKTDFATTELENANEHTTNKTYSNTVEPDEETEDITDQTYSASVEPDAQKEIFTDKYSLSVEPEGQEGIATNETYSITSEPEFPKEIVTNKTHAVVSETKRHIDISSSKTVEGDCQHKVSTCPQESTTHSHKPVSNSTFRKARQLLSKLKAGRQQCAPSQTSIQLKASSCTRMEIDSDVENESGTDIPVTIHSQLPKAPETTRQTQFHQTKRNRVKFLGEEFDFCYQNNRVYLNCKPFFKFCDL